MLPRPYAFAAVGEKALPNCAKAAISRYCARASRSVPATSFIAFTCAAPPTRLTEILKQNQYSPLPVEKQITIIYAATSGFLDGVPVAECRRFETDLYTFLEAQHAGLVKEVAEKKDLKGELGDRLKAAIAEFTGSFQAKTAN